VPQDGEPLVVPGEDPGSVGEQQSLRREVATDGDEAVDRAVRRRKHEGARERVDGHGARIARPYAR
jgi:hypothetical protein